MGLTSGVWLTKNQNTTFACYGEDDGEIEIIMGDGQNAAIAVCLQTNSGGQGGVVGNQSLFILSEVPFTLRSRIVGVTDWDEVVPVLTTRYSPVHGQEPHTYYYLRDYGVDLQSGTYSYKNTALLEGWFTYDSDFNSSFNVSMIQNMIDRLGGPYVPPPRGQGMAKLVLNVEGQTLTFTSNDLQVSKSILVDDDATIDMEE